MAYHQPGHEPEPLWDPRSPSPLHSMSSPQHGDTTTGLRGGVPWSHLLAGRARVKRTSTITRSVSVVSAEIGTTGTPTPHSQAPPSTAMYTTSSRMSSQTPSTASQPRSTPQFKTPSSQFNTPSSRSTPQFNTPSPRLNTPSPRLHTPSSSRHNSVASPVPASRSSSRRRTPGSAATTAASPASTGAVCVCAAIENRSREIGFAMISLDRPCLLLTQIADTHTYVNSTTNIAVHSPTHILLPNTMSNSRLHKLIFHQFPHLRVVFVSRRYFSEGSGNEMVKKLSGTGTVPPLASAKFLCLSAAAALIKYVDFELNTTFAQGSISCKYQSAEGHMLLDHATAASLEMIFNNRSGSKKDSLFGVIDKTCTTGGARLLRSTLLQPLTDVPTLKLRHDCVEELLASEAMYFGIQSLLKMAPDTEVLLSHLSQIPKVKTPITARRALQDMIALRSTLSLVDGLSEVLQGAKNELLCAIRDSLKNSTPVSLRNQIDKVIDQSGIKKRGKLTSEERNQLAFAIRPGINGLLDVARKTNLESIEDIYSTANQYKEEWQATTMQVKFNASRGYHLAIKTEELEGMKDLVGQLSGDKAIINAAVSRKLTLFTTSKIESFNSRNKESMNDINLLTERVLEKLQDDVRKHLGWLLTFAEGVSLVDMLLSFAGLVSSSEGTFVRPTLVAEGELAVKKGRNLLAEIQQKRQFVPNDIFMTKNVNISIIRGHNMSGKSTYLRQTALIAILAQCGSHVPAEYAQCPIFDRLFTRFATDDSAESNLSTFALEMQETAFILDNATPRSLVLIDELGRGTSPIDGTAIAWSVAESLAERGCFSMLTTHFTQLAELETFYPNIRNQHFEVDTVKAQDQCTRLKFLYRLQNGSMAPDSSAMEMLIRDTGFPQDLIMDIKTVRDIIKNKVPAWRAAEDLSIQAKLFNRVAEAMYNLQHSTLDESGLTEMVKTIKAQLVAVLGTITPPTASSRDPQNTAVVCSTQSPSGLAPCNLNPFTSTAKKSLTPPHDPCCTQQA